MDLHWDDVGLECMQHSFILKLLEVIDHASLECTREQINQQQINQTTIGKYIQLSEISNKNVNAAEFLDCFLDQLFALIVFRNII